MLRSKSDTIVKATTNQSRSLEVSRNRRLPAKRYLRKTDLVDKLLITRTSGRKFGHIGEAWVDPRRLVVQVFDITTRTQILQRDVIGSIEMQTIREVGDVVLIHSDQDFDQALKAERFQLTTLSGLKLIMDNGTVIGKVIDFVFDPENGRITQLVFHMKNFPFARPNFFDQFAISVQNISKIVLSEKIIYLKSEATWKKVGVGEYQFLANLIPSFRDIPDENEVEADRGTYADGASMKLQMQYQKLLDETKRQQEAYDATYGKYTPRKTISRAPTSAPRKQAPLPRMAPEKEIPQRQETKIDDWLVNERAKEELFQREL